MTDELRQRIAALLRKARSDGASEAEAMAAAERAARMMAEAGISQADVEFEEEQASLRTRTPTTRDALWSTVAVCTNCSAITRRDWTPVVIFIGRAPGPQIACYLVDLLNRAVDREIEAFKRQPEYKRRRTTATRRAAVQDFLSGLVARLRMRLRDLFSQSIDEVASAEAHLVLEGRFPDSRPVTIAKRKVRFGSAAGAGYSAGARVQISHGVNGGNAILKIGRAQ